MLRDLAIEQAGWVITPWEQVSAAFGLETRHPLLDLDLVEAALSVSQKLHLARGFHKGLLRVAAAPYLPRKVQTRRGKMSLSGFVIEGLQAAHEPREVSAKSLAELADITAGFDDEFVLPLQLFVADLFRRSDRT